MTYFQKSLSLIVQLFLELKLKYQVHRKVRIDCKMITSISFLNFQKEKNLINIITKQESKYV